MRHFLLLKRRKIRRFGCSPAINGGKAPQNNHHHLVLVWYQALYMLKATAHTLIPRGRTSEVEKRGFSKRLRGHKYTSYFSSGAQKTIRHTKLTMTLLISCMELGRRPAESLALETGQRRGDHLLVVASFIQWEAQQSISFSRALGTLKIYVLDVVCFLCVWVVGSNMQSSSTGVEMKKINFRKLKECGTLCWWLTPAAMLGIEIGKLIGNLRMFLTSPLSLRSSRCDATYGKGLNTE